MNPTITAIIPAGGAGLRMNQSQPKQFCELAGIPILVHTIRAFQKVDAIDHIVLVVPTEYVNQSQQLIGQYGLEKIHAVVTGGILRQNSVKIGLDNVPGDTEFVAVHDGARPLVSPDIITKCIEQAQQSGAAIAAIPVKDTLKSAGNNNIIKNTIDRSKLWQAQTPQVVRTALLKKAFTAAEKDGFEGTDEASLLEHISCPVSLVEGSEQNIKITRPEDLLIAEALFMNDKKQGQCTMKIGHGYDVHRLVPDRDLILGGVTIPHPLGLLGHSDADVLTHALCDAILGAIGEGDIGKHFPDTDPKYKGISSISLLEHVAGLAKDKGYMLSNADITVVAEKPKLNPHFQQMRTNLATACRVNEEAINLKATTTEKLDFAGREEGIATHAIVLLKDIRAEKK